MRKKHITAVLISILGVVLVFTLGSTLVKNIIFPPPLILPSLVLTTPQPEPSPQQAGDIDVPVDEVPAAPILAGQPARLVYQAIGLDAEVGPIGADGDAMGVIASNTVVSWFDLSHMLGEEGNTILAAHRNWKGSPGPFYHLDKCAVGDAVSITDTNGVAWDYVVDKIEVVEYENPPAYIMQFGGEERVTLITCTGAFSLKHGTAEQRIIVILKRA